MGEGGPLAWAWTRALRASGATVDSSCLLPSVRRPALGPPPRLRVGVLIWLLFNLGTVEPSVRGDGPAHIRGWLTWGPGRQPWEGRRAGADRHSGRCTRVGRPWICNPSPPTKHSYRPALVRGPASPTRSPALARRGCQGAPPGAKPPVNPGRHWVPSQGPAPDQGGGRSGLRDRCLRFARTFGFWEEAWRRGSTEGGAWGRGKCPDPRCKHGRGRE